MTSEQNPNYHLRIAAGPGKPRLLQAPNDASVSPGAMSSAEISARKETLEEKAIRLAKLEEEVADLAFNFERLPLERIPTEFTRFDITSQRVQIEGPYEETVEGYPTDFEFSFGGLVNGVQNGVRSNFALKLNYPINNKGEDEDKYVFVDQRGRNAKLPFRKGQNGIGREFPRPAEERDLDDGLRVVGQIKSKLGAALGSL